MNEKRNVNGAQKVVGLSVSGDAAGRGATGVAEDSGGEQHYSQPVFGDPSYGDGLERRAFA